MQEVATLADQRRAAAQSKKIQQSGGASVVFSLSIVFYLVFSLCWDSRGASIVFSLCWDSLAIVQVNFLSSFLDILTKEADRDYKKDKRALQSIEKHDPKMIQFRMSREI